MPDWRAAEDYWLDEFWPEDEPPPTLADLSLLEEGWTYLGEGAWKRNVKVND